MDPLTGFEYVQDYSPEDAVIHDIILDTSFSESSMTYGQFFVKKLKNVITHSFEDMDKSTFWSSARLLQIYYRLSGYSPLH